MITTVILLVLYVLIGLVMTYYMARVGSNIIIKEYFRLHRLVARLNRTIDDVEGSRDEAHSIILDLYLLYGNQMHEHLEEEIRGTLKGFIGLDDEDLDRFRGKWEILLPTK